MKSAAWLSCLGGVILIVNAVLIGGSYSEASYKAMADETYSEDIEFPENFEFGAASASYQVEGAWNEDGKGENIWDRMVHTHQDWIEDKSTGDVAADSYHRYREDVAAVKAMGMDFYRFSISWSRVLPTGEANKVNQAGVDYYNNLINELLHNNIQPLVTMYHWDLPQPLQDLGGWLNPLLAEYFEDYARVLYTKFGDRVKRWFTFNEPAETCSGYTSLRFYAPGVDMPGRGDYLAAHTILLAHARAYHLYHKEFQYDGKVAIVLNTDWAEPKTNILADTEASERAMQFQLGWFAHPIYKGDYPEVMKQRIAKNSASEGRLRSRLPEFNPEQIQFIKGTADIFCLNHYTTTLVSPSDEGKSPSKERDQGVAKTWDPSWPTAASVWLKVVPWGLRKLLVWISREYGNPEILITENGFSDHGELKDTARADYHVSYLSETLKAITLDGCNVTGYTAWSIIDNFEWMSGYTEKFGLYRVDIDDPSRVRTAKYSSRVMTEIIRTRKLPQGGGPPVTFTE